ncbi:MAG: aminopeptidase P N-terminal domain-containing protein [Campylobacterales bacterium]|nr:aminopeptidase P N-terminal domain-containing protein [Campylobacterales bacterium]
MQEGLAVWCAAAAQTRSNDTEFPFRQESNFYYLSGLREEGAVIVLYKSPTQRRSILFIKEPSEQEKLWVGGGMGVERAKAQTGFEEVFDVVSFEPMMADLLKNMPLLYLDLFGENAHLSTLRATCKVLIHQRGVQRSPRTFSDAHQLTQRLRLIKSDEEILLIRRAIAITALAHEAAMCLAKAGMFEDEISTEIDYIFARNKARAKAYESIVAGGDRANTLHYIANDQVLEAGTLLLIDAGCEWEMYASDITRTFPVGGRFLPPQRALYAMVLEVQERIIAMIAPGVRKKELQSAAERWLCEGMVTLGILQGECDALIEAKAHKKYFPHGIGHWLGLDVHDPCPYVDAQGEEIPFVPGMVLTIEPGIYIRADDTEVPECYRGIGIRIEDDVLITPEGCENLSAAIPKSIEAIEALTCKD